MNLNGMRTDLKIAAAVVVAAVAFALSGCGKGDGAAESGAAEAAAVESGDAAAAGGNNAKDAAKVPEERNFSPLSPRFKPEDAIARVNGHDITKAEYDLWCNLRGQIYCIRHRLPLKGKNKELDRFLKSSAMRVLQELVKRELVRGAAEKAGVEPTDEQVAEKEREFMESLGRPKDPFASVVKRLGPKYGPALADEIRRGALEDAYLEKWATNNLSVVTKEEIDEQIAFNVKFNEEIAALNAESHRKAEAARAEVVEKGRYFAEVAKERAELCPEQGARWDVIELDELEASDPFAQWLAKAETGDISGPIDFDDGLAIVGVVSKDKNESSIHPGQEVDMYEVVRILFKAYVPRTMLDTEEEWREAMLEYRRAEARKALGAELNAAAEIEFPNGEQIFDAKKPKKGPKKGKPVGAMKQQKGKPKDAKAKPKAPAKPASGAAQDGEKDAKHNVDLTQGGGGNGKIAPAAQEGGTPAGKEIAAQGTSAQGDNPKGDE